MFEDAFTFEALHAGGRKTTVTNALQVGLFAVFPHDGDSWVLAHWRTGYSLCICSEFDLAMKVVDDASRFCERDPDTDEIKEADEALGAVNRWIECIAKRSNGAFWVTPESYKGFREWRTG